MNNLLAFVIEDEVDLAKIFSKALQAAGLTVEVIPDGLEAIQRLTETVPVMIVLDMHLPSVDGLEILSRLRQDPRFSATRVIVATADANMSDLAQEEADLVLVKPVSYSQLRDLVLRLLPA
jgi:chemosensory pili system protein ChpA (sensor histidine kinase/response regulator)